MSWTYEIATGNLLGPDGSLVATGYSGNGIGKNSTLYQNRIDVGPIPMGSYEIGPAMNSPQMGPHVMSLTPFLSNEMYGRSGFFIHGDAINDPGHASDGCVVMPLQTRIAISTSGDDVLDVVSGLFPGAEA
jgi:hypothetical protein